MSVAQIQARVAAIQSQFGRPPVAAAPVAAPARGADATVGPVPTFERALTEATSGGPDGGTGWAAKLPAEAGPFLDDIRRAADAAGVDPRLVAAVAWTESGFRPDAVSSAGARGLMQLMPATARGLGVDPRDPTQNLEGGARYLAQQLQRFGRTDLALAAYNAGPGNVARHGGIPPFAETRAYVERVLERLGTL